MERAFGLELPIYCCLKFRKARTVRGLYIRTHMEEPRAGSYTVEDIHIVMIHMLGCNSNLNSENFLRLVKA